MLGYHSKITPENTEAELNSLFLKITHSVISIKKTIDSSYEIKHSNRKKEFRADSKIFTADLLIIDACLEQIFSRYATELKGGGFKQSYPIVLHEAKSLPGMKIKQDKIDAMKLIHVLRNIFAHSVGPELRYSKMILQNGQKNLVDVFDTAQSAAQSMCARIEQNTSLFDAKKAEEASCMEIIRNAGLKM